MGGSGAPKKQREIGSRDSVLNGNLRAVLGRVGIVRGQLGEAPDAHGLPIPRMRPSKWAQYEWLGDDNREKGFDGWQTRVLDARETIGDGDEVVASCCPAAVGEMPQSKFSKRVATMRSFGG
ncbi:hypothetical protein VPNG_01883 [Cytospora leucostoma]|uniref:Uncharacterized protein n=1 Tax=Cytospora leucostoma TaxID=1230097 RepID=A0A423XIK3_9PEZI|nr:hypothetical protein VPNG_01883 [Cytospora leucostoma]